MRVAIVGGPGVGKSTLVRQLGDLYHHGSYGEGEKGVWAPEVLADIEAGLNPVGVTAYFGWIYDANYRDAAAHERPGSVAVSYTPLRAHETVLDLVCRLLLEQKTTFTYKHRLDACIRSPIPSSDPPLPD